MILKDRHIGIGYNFDGFSIKFPLKLFSILIRATFKGKKMLPIKIGSISFPLIGAYIFHRRGFNNVETYSTVQKSVFGNTDTNIVRRCVQLLLIVQLKSKLNLEVYFRSLIFWLFLFFTSNSTK